MGPDAECAGGVSQEWMSGIASLEGLKLEEVDSTSTLYNLCKAVEFLHARSLCHRALTPQALVWFANQKRWKLISFGNWARTGDVAPPSYNIRYAAPELLLADIKGVSTCMFFAWISHLRAFERQG